MVGPQDKQLITHYGPPTLDSSTMTRCFIKISGPPNQSSPRYFAPPCPPLLPALMLTMMVFLAVHDSSETKIYALNLSLLKTKEVVDILFIQIRTILLKLLYRAMLSINTSIIKGYLIFYVSLIFST